jgi:hypothetical protein
VAALRSGPWGGVSRVGTGQQGEGIHFAVRRRRSHRNFSATCARQSPVPARAAAAVMKGSRRFHGREARRQRPAGHPAGGHGPSWEVLQKGAILPRQLRPIHGHFPQCALADFRGPDRRPSTFLFLTARHPARGGEKGLPPDPIRLTAGANPPPLLVSRRRTLKTPTC